MVRIHLEDTPEKKQQAMDIEEKHKSSFSLCRNMVHYIPLHLHHHPQIPAQQHHRNPSGAPTGLQRCFWRKYIQWVLSLQRLRKPHPFKNKISPHLSFPSFTHFFAKNSVSVDCMLINIKCVLHHCVNVLANSTEINEQGKML